MLMNRVSHEATNVAISFDGICQEAVGHLETIYSRVAGVLYIGLENSKATGDELRQSCGTVLSNALKSLTAAFALLRSGWRLQPYLCLRNGMEAASVVLYLIQRPDELQKFKDGNLETTKTITVAKNAIPPIGRLYGILSDEFTHIGKPFLHLQKGNVYTDSEWEMWQCLASIAGFCEMLYLITELVFYDLVSDHHCWVRVDGTSYRQQRSKDMTEWHDGFARIYRPHYKGMLSTLTDGKS